MSSRRQSDQTAGCSSDGSLDITASSPERLLPGESSVTIVHKQAFPSGGPVVLTREASATSLRLSVSPESPSSPPSGTESIVIQPRSALPSPTDPAVNSVIQTRNSVDVRSHAQKTSMDAHTTAKSPQVESTSKQSGKKWFSGRQTERANERTDVESQARGESIARRFFNLGVSLGRAVASKVEDLSENDVIIAVMGPTGTGKSSFIEAATGFKGVGHSLMSYTSDIRVVKYVQPDGLSADAIIFVDTPGFDDTKKSDVEILNMIAGWLKKTYQRKITLAGILYFHRISDNRMAGSPLKNLRMFKQLCGESALHKIILTTTMWDEVDEEIGTSRETQLQENYWKSMLDGGSLCARFLGTFESAWSILEPFLLEAEIGHAVLLQQELVEMKMQLRETSAGQSLFVEMEALAKQQKELLQRIRDETKGNADEDVVAGLRNEYAAIRMELERTLAEMQTLKIPIGKRLLRSFKTRFSFLKKRM